MRKKSSIRNKKSSIPLYTTTKRNKQKFEGFDVTGKTLSKTKNAQSKFEKITNKKIDQVKHKNKQQLKKDAYIKDLQSKVKTLDFEMRILKNKENEKQTEIQQMNRFFTDALKTKYTQYEQGNIKSIDRLREYEIDLKDQQKQLADENFKLKQILTTLQNELYEQREKNEKNEESLAVQLYIEQNKNENYIQNYKVSYEEFKNKNDQNLKIQREFEKKKILEPQQLEDRQLRIKALKKQEQNRYEIFLKMEEDILKLKQKVNREGFKKEAEQKNNDLECYLLKVEKGITMCQSRIGELQMMKKMRQREKEQQNEEKRNLMQQIDKLKDDINRQQYIQNIGIGQEVENSNREKCRFLDKELQKQKLILNYQQDLKRKEEEDIDRLTNEKIQYQQDYLDEEQKRDQLLSDKKELNQKILELQKENIVIELVKKRIEIQQPDLEIQIQKLQEKIPKLQQIKQECLQKLRHFKKQK